MLVPVTTVVGDDEEVQLVKLMCEVQDGGVIYIDSIEKTRARLIFSLRPCDREITWIIGHYDKASDEGKALLVAYALTRV